MNLVLKLLAHNQQFYDLKYPNIKTVASTNSNNYPTKL